MVRGLTSVKGLEGVELLDTLMTYLRRVHGVNYYDMTEVAEAKGLRHRDKLPRRRPLSDNWFKDERGSHKERDPRGNGAERIDRSDSPQGKNDYLDKGNDEPMLDAFGGQDIHASSFSPDIPPPPVLIPVPTAGCIGDLGG
ncbi:hypothetical protein Dimus_000830 [Dionaea muscipula]